MQKLWASLAVILLVVTAGCLSATMETTVHDDGMVELEGEIDVSPELVSLIEEELEDSEYDSVGELLVAEFNQDEEFDEEWNNFQMDYEEQNDGSIILTMTSDPTDPDQIEGWVVNVTEDEATFETDEGFEEDDEFSEDDVELTFIVHMPGEIQDTNGDQIDDDSVQWTYADHQGVGSMQVTSSVNEDDSDSIPGFGLGMTALAVALIAGAAAYGRRY